MFFPIPKRCQRPIYAHGYHNDENLATHVRLCILYVSLVQHTYDVNDRGVLRSATHMYVCTCESACAILTRSFGQAHLRSRKVNVLAREISSNGTPRCPASKGGAPACAQYEVHALHLQEAEDSLEIIDRAELISRLVSTAWVRPRASFCLISRKYNRVH